MDAPNVVNILVDFPPTHQYQRQVIRGVSQFCHENPTFRLRTAASVTNFLKDGVDGVIAFVGGPRSVERVSQLARPVVNVSSNILPVPVPTVATDSRLIGRLAAEHLVRQGYATFACLFDSRHFYSRERLAGFADAIAFAGRPSESLDTATLAGLDPAHAHARTADWLRRQVKPLGLFTYNDLQAVALIDVCRDAHLHVPNDVGVVGVDNDDLLAQLARPGLTSVDPGTPVIGYRAAELLARMIHGDRVRVDPIFIPPKEVVIRESSQPLSLMDERLVTALQFIRKNATGVVGVNEVLDVVPMSRRSLERLFTARLGLSPAEEIRRVRINRAKWLILEGNRPLDDVAAECGYSAFRNFAAAFRREVGVTPSEYRRRFRPAPKAGTPAIRPSEKVSASPTMRSAGG